MGHEIQIITWNCELRGGLFPHSVREDAFQCETENMSAAAVASVIKSVEKLAARVAYIMCLVCECVSVCISQAALYSIKCDVIENQAKLGAAKQVKREETTKKKQRMWVFVCVCLHEWYISKSLSKLFSYKEKAFRWLSEQEQEWVSEANEKSIAHASSTVPNVCTLLIQTHININVYTSIYLVRTILYFTISTDISILYADVSMFIFRIICRPRKNLILGESSREREREREMLRLKPKHKHTHTHTQTHNLKPKMLCEWSMLKDWSVLLVCWFWLRQ